MRKPNGKREEIKQKRFKIAETVFKTYALMLIDCTVLFYQSKPTCGLGFIHEYSGSERNQGRFRFVNYFVIVGGRETNINLRENIT